MILAIDVQYVENRAIVAGVTFDNWDSESPSGEFVSSVYDVAEYESGIFYKRELPCILELIREHTLYPEIIIIDGYVYLDKDKKPGLGAYLYNSLHNGNEIIGVAKNKFQGILEHHEIYRGTSLKPLYITTTSPDLEQSKMQITNMFGEHRIPYLLKRADQLCREESKKLKV